MQVSICGLDLFYEVRGEGFPLVCLHGYGVDHRSVKSALEPVCSETKGFCRIYPDLPGMGRSQSHDQILSSDDMLEVVCQFIDQVVGPEQPFALAGYSYGGYLARGVICQMPSRVKGLLLICPVVRFRRDARVLPRFRVWEKDLDFLASLDPEAAKQMDGFVSIQTRAVWEVFRTQILPALDLADPDLMARIRDSEFTFPVDRPQADLNLPVLILTGRHDVAVGYEDALRLLAVYPNAVYVVVPRAGHLLHLEQPGVFLAQVAAWLDRFDQG